MCDLSPALKAVLFVLNVTNTAASLALPGVFVLWPCAGTLAIAVASFACGFVIMLLLDPRRIAKRLASGERNTLRPPCR